MSAFIVFYIKDIRLDKLNNTITLVLIIYTTNIYIIYSLFSQINISFYTSKCQWRSQRFCVARGGSESHQFIFA